MDLRITPLYEQLKLNTRLFLNCLEGADDATAQQRPGHAANSMAFIALHLLDARSYLARLIGLEFRHPFEESLADVRSNDELKHYPELQEIRDAWRELSARLVVRLPDLAESGLLAESPQPFPVEDPSVLGGIAFLAQHESYHIGQLAYLRRYLGLGPMRY